MNYSIQHIADQLKAGREGKGLSQRELSDLSGVTQSQVSRVERGSLDPQLTTLVELARALDLELMLIPRKAVSAVSGIVQSATGVERDPARTRAVARELRRLRDAFQRASEGAEAQGRSSEVLSQIARQVRDLGRFDLPLLDPEDLREISNGLGEDAEDPDAFAELLSRASESLQRIRDQAVHASSERPRQDAPRAAYAVSETDDV